MDVSGQLMYTNYGYDDLIASGEQHWMILTLKKGAKDIGFGHENGLGVIEEFHIQPSAFTAQYNSFSSKGMTLHPSGKGFIGNPATRTICG